MARCPKKIEKEEIDDLFKKYPLPEIMDDKSLVPGKKPKKRRRPNHLMNHPLIKFFEGHP